MRASRRLLVAGAVASFLLAGCGGSDDDTTTPSTQTFDKAALVKPIEVDAGADFEIALDANSTTPYHWVFTRKPDSAVVAYEGRNYETDPGSEGLTGAGGTETFSFHAVAAGTTEIGLAYEEISRDGPTTERVDTTVTVR